MIEVVFDRTTEGNIKAARAYHGLFNGQENETQVVSLAFMLDIGYIDNDITGEYRTRLPEELYMFRQFDDDIEFEEDAEDSGDWFGQYNNKQWEIFKTCVNYGADIRIWGNRNAESICGLLHLCSYLEDKENSLYIVECPRFIMERSKNCFLRCWGMCEPIDLVKHVGDTKRISKDEVCLYAERWRELKRENAKLRALVSDNVISVSEDFYDFLLRKHIPSGDFKQAEIIQRFYDDDVQIGDYWLARRVEIMINAGELEVIIDCKDQYKRVLRKREI